MSGGESTPRAAAELKACCAVTYESDAVALLLGQHYHPGGAELTRRLGRALELRPGLRVLDVASGRGATALLLAAEFGAGVDGVDLGEGSVAAAGAAAREAGLTERVRFVHADAETLPFEDATFDAVVCECALCTFPDKATAAREFARVLRPGGRVGITDVTVRPESLDPRLADLAGWVACLADARPAEGYADLLTAAGLRMVLTERHDEALGRMVDEIDARLGVLRMLDNAVLAGLDLDRARELTAVAKQAVTGGTAGYALLAAAKPGW